MAAGKQSLWGRAAEIRPNVPQSAPFYRTMACKHCLPRLDELSILNCLETLLADTDGMGCLYEPTTSSALLVIKAAGLKGALHHAAHTGGHAASKRMLWGRVFEPRLRVIPQTLPNLMKRCMHATPA